MIRWNIFCTELFVLSFSFPRSHLDDVYDLSWSPCSQFLLSGSVDNSAIITNVHKNQKISHLSDAKSFVQGVAWNPKHNLLATHSSDR